MQLTFDQLSATLTVSASSQSPAENKFDLEAGTLLDDQPRLEALVKGIIKSKLLCGRGDVITEWRFCGDEYNARLLLHSLVEELTSRLTRFNSLFSGPFRMDDATIAVVPNAHKLLEELLEYLCAGPALVLVREAHSRFNLDIADYIHLLLRRTCPVFYKTVHEKYTEKEVWESREPELTLSKDRKGEWKCGKKGKGKGKKGKCRVTFHPGANKQFFGNCSCGGRHRQVDCVHTQHLAAHSMRLDPATSAENAFKDVLAARYQAAYQHSEEAVQSVCWEHGTPDICDPTESVCTYLYDGSLYFSAYYLTQEDDTVHSPAWGPHGCADFEWDAWDSDPYTQEQHEEWERNTTTEGRSFLPGFLPGVKLCGG
ncbi:hypothetical protein CYMTET_7133 [Cymbomonas tetramitiformis]|uniref:Uncharacterized protein n=1 Tax=Cymbomonas tetramitiformis TaxID=36881 RepID=A0AAE0GVU0_9CHLO|nr:hypothetical protein CYMTET_7133 [Cymbomonas tetramitiformis]